ncbi:hypothetical protein ANCCAN_27249 [Ancylostoma caninum]|uniref:Uncharacterized protein n=1 Tax=Ancylostoma caninum TaxID=29170 RepID=A0A368F606_ANCCA|nr:hypothetical protein ANCCAN_27249 [Ancylostoma caninum]
MGGVRADKGEIPWAVIVELQFMSSDDNELLGMILECDLILKCGVGRRLMVYYCGKNTV